MVLTELEKKQRKREADRKYYENNKEQKKESNRKYYENNKEKIAEINKEYRLEYYENNKDKLKEKNKEYYKTDNGKKSQTLSKWKQLGLIETKEFLDEIYELYLTQEECNACGCVLTRTGKCSNTDVTMDHDHSTGKFRHIICGYCNRMDNWNKHFII